MELTETASDESENEQQNEQECVTKKKRKFYAKEFRENLKSAEPLASIKEFVSLCSEENAQDFALEYIEKGGSTQEILKVLDTFDAKKNLSDSLTVLQACNLILLKVLSKKPAKLPACEESCRECLVKHFPVIKSLLSLNSSSKQRKGALKLLSTMTTVSPTVAKDVLGYVSFDDGMLEVLTNSGNGPEGSSVRTAFIHFLLSFLVDGNTSIITSFLEKRGLLTSIFMGLLYDKVEIVELVLTTVQKKILEDKYLSKTIKMNTFNTNIIKSLVNLYNWKGPSPRKKGNFKKRNSEITAVDPEQKRLVCECVHEFLLVLCASKHGIIFRDPTVGLSGKKYNPLMSTVLHGLGNPWDHPLACELVTKICVACPDLVKSVMKDTVPFLQPRTSQKWLNAVRFVKKLIKSLTVDTVCQFFEKLSIKQIVTLIETLCIPHNILQIITTDNLSHEHMGVRHEIIELLHIMCSSVSNYLNFIENASFLSLNDQITLKNMVTKYLEQNLPNVTSIINVWKKSTTLKEALDDPDVPVPSLTVHLSTILDILYEYHIICLPLFDDISNEIDSLNFLQTIQKCSDDSSLSSEMYVKAINLFLLCDFATFLPTTELFSYVLPLLLDIYSKSKHSRNNIELTLFKLLKNTGIFEGCENEIKIWLYSILECEIFNENIGNFLLSAIILTNKHFLKYSKEIMKIRGTVSEVSTFNFKALIQSLSLDVNPGELVYEKNTHTLFSPLVVGILNNLLKMETNEVKTYLNIAFVHLFHAQTIPNILVILISQEKYSTVLNKHLLKYINGWNECSLVSLKKIYENRNTLTNFSKFLISEDNIVEIQSMISQNMDNYQLILMSRTFIFYLTQFLRTQSSSESIENKYFNTAIHLLKTSEQNYCFKDCLDAILKHPVLTQFFSPICQENSTETTCTKFVLNIVEELTKIKSKTELEEYLNSYRTILLRQLHIALQRNKKRKKPPKDNKFMKFVYLLDLSYEHCRELLKICCDLPVDCIVSLENTPSAVIELICYILNRCLVLYAQDKSLKPFSVEFLANINEYLLHLNTYKIEINLETFETTLYNYLQQFPHNISCFNDETFKSLLLKPTVNRSTARLAMLFIKCNSKFLTTALNILDDIIEKRELIFSLLNATDFSIPALENYIQTIYTKHEQIILKVLNKPQKTASYLIEYYDVVIRLIKKCLGKEIYEDFGSKVHKFDVTEFFHFEIISSVFDKAITNSEDKNKPVSNYIGTVMNLVINILKRAEKTDDDGKKLENILKSFCTFLNKVINIYKIQYRDPNLSKSNVFQTYSKLSLKFGLQGNLCLIETLKRLCEFCDNENEYLGMLFEMSVSHSESLNILLDSANKIKPHFVNLLLILCKKSPSVMSKNHIPVWLGAYEGTLALSDQCILQLLCLYEDADMGFHEYRPFLWGKAAVGHYSVRFGLETALWRQPKPNEILNLLDIERIKHTITYFPKTRMLMPNQPFYSHDDTSVYDPAFYLPLLSHLLAPESTIKWYQCKFGAIALVIMALTSDVEDVRSAACHVLARFHSHLEAASYGKDRLLWLHFIEAICRAASTMENLHLSTVAGIFMSRCALVFNRPDHVLYNSLANYIMAKECPDLSYVPEMLELLHNNDINYYEHRSFILEVMRDGLKTDNDLKVMFRSMAFKLIMDMYNSAVINQEGKRLILEIVTNAVSLPTGARVLTSAHGLLSWLFSVIKSLNRNDIELLTTSINLIHKMVTALEGELYQRLHFNILLCLVSIIDCLKIIRISVPTLVKYVSILYIVYNSKSCILTRNNLNKLLSTCVRFLDCHICNYYLDFGSDFIESPTIKSDDIEEQGVYYLKLLTLKWIEINKDNCTKETLMQVD